TLSTLASEASSNLGPRPTRSRRSQRPVARFRLEVGPVPLHHQVYADLKSSLDSGEYAVGERLPPERELARLYGCSLITIRRALDELSREGRLGREQG